jgi:hypothetical protein
MITRHIFLVAASGWFLMAVTAVVATSVAPEIVVGKTDGIGTTSHDLVRCVLWDQYAPHNIIGGYFQIAGTLRQHPFQSDPHVFLTINSGTNTVASLSMGAMEMDNATALYSFTMRRDLLKDSFIEVYAPTQYVRLNLSTVRILTDKEFDKLTLSKALRPSHYVGGLPNAGTNAPTRKP